jgi:hypothetical protein
MGMRLLPALLVLAACGGPSTQTGEDPSAGEGDAPQPTVQQQVPENLVDDAGNEAVPLEPPPLQPTPSASPVGTFPASFQGRWGLVPADCEPGRADAKGLMEVDAKTLRFYESRGTVTRFVQPRPGRIEATLAMTGEGQEWTRTDAFTLSSDGKALIREERDPPASLRYARCPNAGGRG